MPVLNLRNVPDPLMRELRAEAARAGQPFHAFCVGLLEAALHRRRGPQATAYPPISTLVPASMEALATMAKAAATHIEEANLAHAIACAQAEAGESPENLEIVIT